MRMQSLEEIGKIIQNLVHQAATAATDRLFSTFAHHRVTASLSIYSVIQRFVSTL